MVAGRACSLIRWCLFPMVSIWFRFSLVSDKTSSTRSSLIVNACQVLYRFLHHFNSNFLAFLWYLMSLLQCCTVFHSERPEKNYPMTATNSWHEQPGYQWKSRLYLKEWDRAGWSPLLLLVLRRLVTCWGTGSLSVYPIIYDVFFTSKRWLFGISETINSITQELGTEIVCSQWDVNSSAFSHRLAPWPFALVVHQEWSCPRRLCFSHWSTPKLGPKLT